MIRPLSDADDARCGGKAKSLARLLHAGLPVPDGFVVSADAGSSHASEIGDTVRDRIDLELSRLGEPVVAVRSSAADEDTADASAAGIYESVLGIRGTDEVCAAIAFCRRSANAARANDYRRRGGHPGDLAVEMSVLVQVLVDAEISGVMFTPQLLGEPTRIESSWGLGLSVVNGGLTPDAFEVGSSGTITATAGVKDVRTDALGERCGTKTTAVANEMQTLITLEDEMLLDLESLGTRVSAVLGGPQDIEWAIADGDVWIVQSRPVTAPLPAMPDAGRGISTETGPASGSHACACSEDHAYTGAGPGETMAGTPGSHGVVTAHARIVSGLSAFAEVRPGELVICSYTDPAWTPLFSIASGVITEVGGALSHAAIVAREYGIPAILGVASATSRIANGDLITVDGTAGTITMH